MQVADYETLHNGDDMDLKKIGRAIAGAGAKLLGGVVGGPVGAGVAGLVAHKLGLNADDEKGILAAVSDPANGIKLRELEHAHEEELERLRLRETELEIQDRTNARQREMEFTKLTGKRDWSQTILAWTVVVGFLGSMAAFMAGVNPSSNEILLVLIGALAAKFNSIIDYFFGSSKGSADKTAIIAAQQKNGG